MAHTICRYSDAQGIQSICKIVLCNVQTGSTKVEYEIGVGGWGEDPIRFQFESTSSSIRFHYNCTMFEPLAYGSQRFRFVACMLYVVRASVLSQAHMCLASNRYLIQSCSCSCSCNYGTQGHIGVLSPCSCRIGVLSPCCRAIYRILLRSIDRAQG